MTSRAAQGPAGPLTTVDADLRIDVDPGDGAGRVSAHLGGSGHRLTLRTADATAWWPLLAVPGVMTDVLAAAGPAPSPLSRVRGLLRRSPRLSAAGQAADALRHRGMRVDIVDDRGPVISLGADVHSAPGRILVGSDAVRLGSPRVLARWVRPMLAGRFRRS